MSCRRAGSSPASCAASARSTIPRGSIPISSHERFHEAHDLIIRAWTEPGPFAFDGDHFSLRYVNLWAAALPEPASAGLDPVAGVERDGRLGRRSKAQIPVPGDLLVGPTSSRATTTPIATGRGNIRL